MPVRARGSTVESTRTGSARVVSPRWRGVSKQRFDDILAGQYRCLPLEDLSTLAECRAGLRSSTSKKSQSLVRRYARHQREDKCESCEGILKHLVLLERAAKRAVSRVVKRAVPDVA